MSKPSKSLTTDIWIFWKVWDHISDYQFFVVCSCEQKRRDVLRTAVFYSSHWVCVTGAIPQAKALLSATLTSAHRWVMLRSVHKLIGLKRKRQLLPQPLANYSAAMWKTDMPAVFSLGLRVNTAPFCSYPLASKYTFFNNKQSISSPGVMKVEHIYHGCYGWCHNYNNKTALTARVSCTWCCHLRIKEERQAAAPSMGFRYLGWHPRTIICKMEQAPKPQLAKLKINKGKMQLETLG